MPHKLPLFSRLALLLAGASAILLPVSAVNAQIISPAPATVNPSTSDSFVGVILLKNGGIALGEISQDGDRWFVKNSGRESQITAGNVDLIAKSLDELYVLQRQRITRPTAEAHRALADWCLRNGLLTQAEHELSDAKQLDARHPRLRLLEQRLAVAKTTRPAVAPPESGANLQALVVQTAVVVESAPAQPAPAPPVSDAAVERFTRRIQPILVNNCTTAGCHQPGGAQSFQIDRALLHGLSNRRTTMSNLQAALAHIDRKEPLKSPLLTVPRAPHGGMPQPIFSPSQNKLVEQLAEWVAFVGEKPTVAMLNVDGNAQAVRPEQAPPPFAEPARFDESPGSMLTGYGSNVQPWRPKDEFDPEIFNRRYRN